MRKFLALMAALLLFAGANAYAAGTDDDDLRMFGRILSLVQSFARIAAESPDPQAMQNGIDSMIAGRNAEANRLARELLSDMDLPAEHRGTLASIVRDFAVVARREQARTAERGDPVPVERALQARRDLHAIGLSYHDAAQFLAAVRRDDALAVELYLFAQGVNLSARDADGASALDIARRAGNRRIEQLLASVGVRR